MRGRTRSRAVTVTVVTALVVTLTVGTAPAGVDEICPPPGETAQDRFPDDGDSVHHDNINCAAGYDLVRGFGDGTFRPNGAVTRGQMATMVVGMIETAKGADLPPAPNRFPDDDTSVHAANIDKAAAAGVVQGFEDGTFRPNATLTRAQAATFMRNAAAAADAPVPASSQDAFLDDQDSVHEDNIDALAAVRIVNGKTATTYDPSGTNTRGQQATQVVQTAGWIDDNDKWWPTEVPDLVDLGAIDADGSGNMTAGDALRLSFDEPVVTGSSLELTAADGDLVTLTDTDPTPSGATAATFTTTDGGTVLTVLVDAEPTVGGSGDGTLDGEITITDADGIIDPDRGRGWDPAAEGDLVTFVWPERQETRVFTVTPTEGAELETVPAADEPDGSDDRTYTVLDPRAGTDHVIALVPTEDVSATGRVRFIDADNDGEADTVGDTDAVITTVNGSAVTPGAQHTATPSGGEISFVVDHETLDRESVVPVVFVDADGDGMLDLDEEQGPAEDFGVGGPTTWIPPEATAGTYTVTVEFADQPNDRFIGDGLLFLYGDPGDAYVHSDDEIRELTLAEFEQILGVGDELRIDYDPDGPSRFDVRDDVPGPPRDVTAEPVDEDADGRLDDVALNWTSPPNIEASAAPYTYDVERAPVTDSGPGTYETVANDLSDTSYTDTDPGPGTYAYRISAKDNDGNATAAEPVQIQLTAVPPATGPRIDTITTDDGGNADELDSGDVITLEFDRPVVAEDGDVLTVSDDDDGDGVAESLGDTVATITLGDEADHTQPSSNVVVVTLTSDPSPIQPGVGTPLATAAPDVTLVAVDGLESEAGADVNLAASTSTTVLGDDVFDLLSTSIDVDDVDADGTLSSGDTIVIVYDEHVAAGAGHSIEVDDGSTSATITLGGSGTVPATWSSDANVLTLTLGADSGVDTGADVTASTLTDLVGNPWNLGASDDTTA